MNRAMRSATASALPLSRIVTATRVETSRGTGPVSDFWRNSDAIVRYVIIARFRSWGMKRGAEKKAKKGHI